MHALATLGLINPTTELIIVVVIVVASVALRLYLIRRHGGTRAKCPKCGAVFETSRSISLVHLGPLKQIKCPSCGKTSFMKTGVKDPLTWPPEMVKREPQGEKQLSEEELEKKRIEDSKYEKT
jgi:ribosomal protein S27AE